jgi:hypothetical protein
MCYVRPPKTIKEAAMKQYLDMTTVPDLVEALTRAVTYGFVHGYDGSDKPSTEDLRRECGVTRWRGGSVANQSTHMMALRAAYMSGRENGIALHEGEEE